MYRVRGVQESQIYADKAMRPPSINEYPTLEQSQIGDVVPPPLLRCLLDYAQHKLVLAHGLTHSKHVFVWSAGGMQAASGNPLCDV